MWLKKSESDIDTLLKDKKYLQALAAIADAGGDNTYPDIDVILENAFDQIYTSPTDDTGLDMNKRLLTALVDRLGLQSEYAEILRLLEAEEEEVSGHGSHKDVWDEGGHKRY